MTTIVFSKDRALQLEAFLRSYQEHVTPMNEVQVLYADSSLRHHEAYRQVFDRFSWAVPHFQGDRFKYELLELIPDRGNVVFFVDDQVFIRSWRVEELPFLSLRLGLHLTHCYPTNKEQLVPSLQSFGNHLWWLWSQGDGDWGYPLSIDGHVFEANVIRTMICEVDFRSPNTLEFQLQRFVSYFSLLSGLCYRNAKVVNIPWTRVQTDWENRSMNLSADDMLAHWEAGRRIDLRGIYGVLNESCHQEFPLVLEDRA